MPLKSGKGKKVRDGNIKEMIGSFESTGKIGNSKPGSKKKAIKQAVAAAYAKQR